MKISSWIGDTLLYTPTSSECQKTSFDKTCG
jgi:hypothetical protein